MPSLRLFSIPYLLTFPGLFGTTGVIDGPLSTAWFFVLWRTGFPSFVIGYALLKDADAGRDTGEARFARRFS